MTAIEKAMVWAGLLPVRFAFVRLELSCELDFCSKEGADGIESVAPPAGLEPATQ